MGSYASLSLSEYGKIKAVTILTNFGDNMTTIILDTETTNLPHLGGEACEIAYIELKEQVLLPQSHSFIQEQVIPNLGNFEGVNWFHQTFMPKGEFSPKASEVNGFTKENLVGSPCISTFVFPTDVEYLIGHTINFDWQILKKPQDVKLICTKELAIKYLTKESGKGTKGVNTLTGLIERYYPEEAKELIANAHSALQDCKLCYLILLKVLEAAPELDSFEKLSAQCNQPSWSVTGIKQDSYTKDYYFTFGNYVNELVIDVLRKDKGYLTWIVEKSMLSKGLKDFVKQFMIDNR
jgi:DNA polymerase III epsilon subunit-like protein